MSVKKQRLVFLHQQTLEPTNETYVPQVVNGKPLTEPILSGPYRNVAWVPVKE